MLKAAIKPLDVPDKPRVYYRGYTMSDWTFCYTAVRLQFSNVSLVISNKVCFYVFGVFLCSIDCECYVL